VTITDPGALAVSECRQDYVSVEAGTQYTFEIDALRDVWSSLRGNDKVKLGVCVDGTWAWTSFDEYNTLNSSGTWIHLSSDVCLRPIDL